MKFCVNRNEKDTIKCHVASIEDMAKAKERIGEISLSRKKVKKKKPLARRKRQQKESDKNGGGANIIEKAYKPNIIL